MANEHLTRAQTESNLADFSEEDFRRPPQRKQRQADYQDGYDEGYRAGYLGHHEENNARKHEAYQGGYRNGYNQGKRDSFFRTFKDWRDDIYVVRDAHALPPPEPANFGFSKRFRKWYEKRFHPREDILILRVDFAVMQRIYITTLRRQLAFAARKCRGKSGLPDEIDATSPPTPNQSTIMEMGRLLSDYCQALENYKHMIEGQKERDEDPFILSSDSAMDREIMRSAGFFGEGIEDRLEELDSTRPDLYGGPRPLYNNAAALRRLTWRFLAAVSGGTTLLIPMVIMVVWKSILVHLLTVSVCVLVFAATLVYSLNETHSASDAWTATVAYAAVLVVFVGSIS